MHRAIITAVISAALVLSGGMAFAQMGQGGGKARGHVTQPAKVQGGRGHVAKGTSGRVDSATARGPKSATHGPKVKSEGKLTAVQQKLQQNTNLANKLQSRLPSGTNLMTAADGFRNLGQFVAAVNVSNNLGIPFSQLKTRMVDDGMSLGQAIQSVPADVDVSTEVRRAERDATRVIDDADRTAKSKAKKNKDGGR